MAANALPVCNRRARRDMRSSLDIGEAATASRRRFLAPAAATLAECSPVTHRPFSDCDVPCPT